MKKVILFVAIMLIIIIGVIYMYNPENEVENLQEASMNFDLSNVKPFLQRISPYIETGFSENEINKVQTELEKMEQDEEREVGSFEIIYKDKKTALNINAFMDSPEAPVIYIFTEPELAVQIQEEMIRFSEEIES